MKNSIILFALVLTAGFFSTSCTDENQEQKELQEALFEETATVIEPEQNESEYLPTDVRFRPIPTFITKIQVYHCTKDNQSLLVFNPHEHNMFLFDDKRFKVQWIRDEQKLPQNDAMLDCVGGGNYKAVVTDLTTNQVSIAKLNIPDVDVHSTKNIFFESAKPHRKILTKKTVLPKDNTNYHELTIEAPKKKRVLNNIKAEVK